MEMDTVLNTKDQDEIQLLLDKKARRNQIAVSVLPLSGVILLVILFTLTTGGQFIGSSNLVNLLLQSFTMVLVAAGATFIYACGYIDMSVGAVLGVAQVAAALIMRDLIPSGLAGLLAAVATGIFCCSITALIHSSLNVPPFVASLCIMNICNGIVSYAVEDGEIFIDYERFRHWDNAGLKAGILAAVLILCFFLFTKTRIGKEARALGGNRVTAVISGINRIRATWICYVILGACVGLAAFFTVARTANVAVGSSSLPLNIITAVVLGGFPLAGGAKAKFHAAIIGAVTVSVLSNGLTVMGLDPAVNLAVKGVLFLIIVGVTTDRGRSK